MIAALWGLFPRLIEENVNGLLDRAEPTALRAFQIYRTCKNEGLFQGSIEKFSASLEEFFSRPRAERRKSQFDRFLDHPMDHHVYSLFQLDFRTAAVKEAALLDVASWAHNLIRVSKKTTRAFVSLEVMSKTLRRLTSPGPFEKAQDIEFDDFCAAWKKTAVKLLGHDDEPEFAAILGELRWLDAELKRAGSLPQAPLAKPVEISLSPGVFLSQAELEWTIAVREAALVRAEMPEWPRSDALAGSPDKQALADLVRVVTLYTAARTSRLPEISRNREKIRATVLDRCATLLGEKDRLAA